MLIFSGLSVCMPPLPPAQENIHALFRTQATEDGTADFQPISQHLNLGIEKVRLSEKQSPEKGIYTSYLLLVSLENS